MPAKEVWFGWISQGRQLFPQTSMTSISASKTLLQLSWEFSKLCPTNDLSNELQIAPGQWLNRQIYSLFSAIHGFLLLKMLALEIIHKW